MFATELKKQSKMNTFTEFSLRFNRRGKLVDQNGEATIEVRMYLNGKQTYYKTGIKITPKGWDEKTQKPKDTLVKRNCESLIEDFKKFESDMRLKHGKFELSYFSLKDVPIQKVAIKQESFTKFFEERLNAEKQLNQPSWRTRKLSFDYFKKFIENVRFDEVNYHLIKSFDLFLHAQKASGRKLHLNTIQKHHKHVRKYVLEAIKFRHIQSVDNPYNDFKAPHQPFESNFLTWEELERFEELIFEKQESMLERCRDMFLFACYTGLRYNDVYKIRPWHLSETSEGLELNYQANKTKKFDKKFLYFLFDGKPQTIARKYMNVKNDITLFKGLTNPKVNANLKIIAKLANVQKATKFKDSRNTFANIMAMLLPITMVQDEMQHSMLSTTQGYLKRNPAQKKQLLSKIDWNRK
jgi:integrase